MDRLSQWWDDTRYAARLAQADAFWQGHGKYVASLTVWDPPYWKSTDTPAWLDELEVHLKKQAALPGLNLPWIRPVFNAMSTPGYWGGKLIIEPITGAHHLAPAVANLDEALRLEPLPFDHPDMDAARALRLYRQACEHLQTDKLWLRTPDFQGPLNTAGEVVQQEEFLIAMHTEPDKVHAFLDRVCDHLIAYVQYLIRETDGRICGNVWPYSFVPPQFGVSLTEDLMPLLSESMYGQFAIPVLRKINRALGPLHIHCCGQWAQHVQTFVDSDLQIAAVEYHHPYTTFEQIAPLGEQAVLIPYIDRLDDSGFTCAADYYRHLLDHTDARYRFWFTCSDDNEPSITEFVERYERAGHSLP